MTQHNADTPLAAVAATAKTSNQCTVPVFDDNYVGRLKACSGRVREAGLPLSLRDKSKVGGMPGKTITDHQVHNYKQYRNQLSQVASACQSWHQRVAAVV